MKVYRKKAKAGGITGAEIEAAVARDELDWTEIRISERLEQLEEPSPDGSEMFYYERTIATHEYLAKGINIPLTGGVVITGNIVGQRPIRYEVTRNPITGCCEARKTTEGAATWTLVRRVAIGAE